jgi:hypothetical protein
MLVKGGAMKKIVLISCVSKKLAHRAKARDLYISTLFTSSLRYAMSLKPDNIYILSAKYGLVDPDLEIEPYNTTLNTMSSAEVKGWASVVLDQLIQRTDMQHDHFVILAGEKYRKHITPHLTFYEVPLRGLTIGKQLQFLKEKNNE